MSYFYKNRTRVIISGSSSQINLITLYCRVIILVAEGFGLGYLSFFLVSKGLFAYLYFYSYWQSRRFPFFVFKSEITHPHPSSAINSQKIGPNETRIAFWEIRPPFCLHVTSMTKHNFLLGFATGSPMMIATSNTIVRLLHCFIFRRLSFVWLSSPSQSMNYAHYQ